MVQFVRPASDVAVGGWSSTPLWSKIDEGSPGDDTTIQSDDNTSPDDVVFTTTNATDPSVHTGHILRAAWNKSAAGGHSIDAVLRLYQGDPGAGGTLIATLSVVGIGETEQTDTLTLTETQAGNITDYTDLHLLLRRGGDTGGNPSTRRSLVVDFVELEVPDAGANTPIDMALASFSFSGLTATITRQLLFSANQGSFNLTGQTVSITRDLLFSADVGSFTLSGQAASIVQSVNVAMDLASFTLSGLDNVITRSLLLVPDLASFTLSGQDSTISVSINIAMESGSLSFSGQPVTVLRSLLFSPDLATFTFTGQEPTIAVSININMDKGSLSFSGLDNSITRSLLFNADSGIISLSGEDLILTTGAFESLLVELDKGEFTLSALPSDTEWVITIPCSDSAKIFQYLGDPHRAGTRIPFYTRHQRDNKKIIWDCVLDIREQYRKSTKRCAYCPFGNIRF